MIYGEVDEELVDTDWETIEDNPEPLAEETEPGKQVDNNHKVGNNFIFSYIHALDWLIVIAEQIIT